MNVAVQTELDRCIADIKQGSEVKCIQLVTRFFWTIVNKAGCLTWHALAVMSDGVSGENAGLRAAPT